LDCSLNSSHRLLAFIRTRGCPAVVAWSDAVVCFAERAIGKAVQREAGAQPLSRHAGPTPIDRIMIILFVCSKGNFYSILPALALGNRLRQMAEYALPNEIAIASIAVSPGTPASARSRSPPTTR
jgi:hypothetical protein